MFFSTLKYILIFKVLVVYVAILIGLYISEFYFLLLLVGFPLLLFIVYALNITIKIVKDDTLTHHQKWDKLCGRVPKESENERYSEYWNKKNRYYSESY